jgi:hypothetical protein
MEFYKRVARKNLPNLLQLKNYLRGFPSFDEIFRTVFGKDIKLNRLPPDLKVFENITGIKQGRVIFYRRLRELMCNRSPISN